jgi:hypothetical protein
MANSGTHDALERLLQRFLRDEMPNLTPAERAALESQFEDRFRDLVERSSGGSGYSFPNLIGFGPEGVKPFDDLPYPRLKADFDESVTPSQIHAAAELYFIYQNERMKVFQVVDVLRRLFALGRMKIQRGPGARGLYILEKWKPLRYSRRDRMIAYRRVFNYGNVPAPQGAVVNRNYHFQFVAFNSALAQYFRDLVVAEVVRGSTEISDSERSRPCSGSEPTCATPSTARATATSWRSRRRSATTCRNAWSCSMRPTSRSPSTPPPNGT